MSLPKFPKADEILTKEQAINMIIASIAMEEAALSHIIEAESKKIKFVIEKLECESKNDIHEIIKINKSVEDLIDKIIDAEILLKNKLKMVLSHSPQNSCQSETCSSPTCIDKSKFKNKKEQAKCDLEAHSHDHEKYKPSSHTFSNRVCVPINNKNECSHIII